MKLNDAIVSIEEMTNCFGKKVLKKTLVGGGYLQKIRCQKTNRCKPVEDIESIIV